MNKKVMILLAMLTLLLMPALAQDMETANWRHGNGGNGGNGNNGNGGNGDGYQGFSLLDGTPFSFSGTVIECGVNGSGLVVSTENGDLTVTGLGPVRYWNSLGVAKPVVGDTVSGNGYTVDYNGVVRNVLADITVNGIMVDLRDDDGKPLWRGVRRGGWGHRGRGGGFGNYAALLEGTPFSYQGEVISDCSPGKGIRGDGFVIATADGNVELRGLGPVRYWESLGLTKPVEGDALTADGYTVDIKGNFVNVLMSIVLDDGTTVQLRDTDTGAPLWRHGGWH
ncbi:MAG: hypothetical protein GY950_32915 [bacterium]|nr:hypothetical protein [bacterium]